MLDCNGFEGLHQYRFSFIYRNLLVWWHSRLSAHQLHSLKSEVIFSLISWTEFGSCGILWFFCVMFFRLFMKAKSSSRKSAFFSWWCPIAFTPTSAFLFTSELEFTVSLKCSNFAVECDWNRILKQIKIWGFFPKLDGFFPNKNLGLFKIAICGKFLEYVSYGIFHENRKPCGWDVFTVVERAVAWSYRGHDATSIFIRSFS